MLEKKKKRLGAHCRLYTIVILCILCTVCMVQTVLAAEPVKVSYYYEEVCASCDGTKDFFELYNRVISSEDKKLFKAEIATYNVFMDSCKAQYEEVRKELQIPSRTSLPVLVIGDEWISGHGNMETQMRDILLAAGAGQGEESGSEETSQAEDLTDTKNPSQSKKDGQADVGTGDNPAVTEEKEATNSAFWSEIQTEVEAAKLPVVLLFSTNGCEDCNAVKEWFSTNELSVQVLEYNIIEKECLNELKAVFRQYQVPEDKQKVPAVFFGDQYLIGKDEIPTIADVMNQKNTENRDLAAMLKNAEAAQNGEESAGNMSIWTLAAAGLLAGFNPCSISMLLMLMSLLLSEKASIWKSGLLYLIGKYAAYLSIGLVIFMTASQISNQTMEKVGGVMNLVMGILFAVAAIFYMIDAVRVYRQDYGNIKMQLPVGLRRMNHNLIKKVSSAGGLMQPFMILMLGVVISFGEFFCTGQIYMASITYLLKDQVKAAIFPFLVYTTAMSIPAVIMILLIQKTRNTEAVSDFMFRHLGVIKIFNAVLFTLFAIYFLVF